MVQKELKEYKSAKLKIHGNYKEITKGTPVEGGEAENEASF